MRTTKSWNKEKTIKLNENVKERERERSIPVKGTTYII